MIVPVPPGSSRILETSVGPVLVEFWANSACVVGVASDGWVRVPIVGGGARVGRTAGQLANALVGLGVDASEAEQLAAEQIGAWEAMPAPPPLSIRERVGRVVFQVKLTTALLARLAFSRVNGSAAKRVVGARFSTEHVPPVRPGSPEYGVYRIVPMSCGWAKFEFWGGSSASLGIYGANGWLPFVRSKRPLFEATTAGAIAALIAQGVPDAEATEIGNHVVRERLARVEDANKSPSTDS